MAHCATAAQVEALKRERPQLVFEAKAGTCEPSCAAAEGFKRLGFYGQGSFCGRCPAELSYHRGLGCCR